MAALGRGGMGTVYLAEDKRLKRRYALKVLLPELATDRVFVDRFLREAQTIAQFEHPNIVNIHSFGEEPSGVVFFTMELLSGEDLDARIGARAERPYSIKDACAWAVQLARAVAAVHDGGLIHRDLKASNAFLARRPDGESVVKLLDFGIVRPEANSDLTRTGIALGTPSHMSPEQCRNLKLDRRSDIYSFGVLLFKLLTGRVPFTGDAVQVATQHCLAPVPMPSSINPAVPPELDALVVRLMAKEPHDRPQSMHEVVTVLASIHASAPAQAGAARTATASEVVRAVADEPGQRAAAPADTILEEQEEATTAPRPAPPVADPETTPNPRAASSVVALPSTRTDPEQAPVVVLPAPTQSRPGRAIVLTAVMGLLAIVTVVIATREPAGVQLAPVAEQPLSPSEAPAVENSRSHDSAVPGPASPPAVAVPESQEVEAPPPTAEAPPPTAEAPPPPVETRQERPVSAPEPEKIKPKAKATPKPAPPASATKPPASSPAPTSTGPAGPPVSQSKSQLQSRARACRKTHNAEGSPLLVFDVATTSDGKVVRVETTHKTALAECLRAAIRETLFEPKTQVGLEVKL
nr:serine/threonine-protein kinase [Nannocystis pusilla]